LKISKFLLSFVFAIVMITPLMFGGCNGDKNPPENPPATETEISIAHTVLGNAVDIWEQIEADATAGNGGASVNGIPSYQGITLDNGLLVDGTGVGSMLAYTHLYAGLYAVESLTAANSTYELGKVFKANGVLTQATADSSTLLNGCTGTNVDLQGIVNKSGNTITVEYYLPYLNNSPTQKLYFAINATFDATSKAISALDVLVYDYGYNVIWFFTGEDFAEMQAFIINHDDTDATKVAFRTATNTAKDALLGKAVQFEAGNYSTEINAGYVKGVDLTEKLFDTNNEPAETDMSVAHVVLGNTVQIWDDILADVETLNGGAAAQSAGEPTYYEGIELTDAFSADYTGVGSFLAYTFLYAGLNTVFSLTADDTDYEMGQAFKATGVLTQATEESSTLLDGATGMNIELSGLVAIVGNNLTMELICLPTINNEPAGQKLFIFMDITFDEETKEISTLEIMLYDYVYNVIWFFTGEDFAGMKGFVINHDDTDTAKVAFRTATNTTKDAFVTEMSNAESVGDFSDEINAGFVKGIQLYEELYEMNNPE